jgi:hypothetical protein
MLDTAGLSKEWWGEAILTPSAHEEQRNHTIRGMGEKEIKSLIYTDMGLLGKGECANQQKAKAWSHNR